MNTIRIYLTVSNSFGEEYSANAAIPYNISKECAKAHAGGHSKYGVKLPADIAAELADKLMQGSPEFNTHTQRELAGNILLELNQSRKIKIEEIPVHEDPSEVPNASGE